MSETIRGKITIASESAPVVELDSEARAAYIRFSKASVKQTEVLTDFDSGCLVTLDLDKDNQVVGIELIGVTEFGIQELVQQVGITIPEEAAGRTRYIPAQLESA